MRECLLSFLPAPYTDSTEDSKEKAWMWREDGVEFAYAAVVPILLVIATS